MARVAPRWPTPADLPEPKKRPPTPNYYENTTSLEKTSRHRQILRAMQDARCFDLKDRIELSQGSRYHVPHLHGDAAVRGSQGSR